MMAGLLLGKLITEASRLTAIHTTPVICQKGTSTHLDFTKLSHCLHDHLPGTMRQAG